MNRETYERFVLSAYITAALWSTNDESDESGGEPMDLNYGPDDLDPETLEAMNTDCKNFVAGMVEKFPNSLQDFDPSQVGHDFWLTRCGHGVGFWDRSDEQYPEEARDWLTEQCEIYGNVDLIVGDDGKIYS